MTKHFCDACGRECRDGINKIEFPCHIAEAGPDFHPYVDHEGNSVSGRRVPVDLCNQCYNAVWKAADTAYRNLKIK